MITLKRFRRIENAVIAAGYGDAITWSENVKPPQSARAFADAAIFVICSSGMRAAVAEKIYDRCWYALRRGESVRSVFGHPGKAAAIEHIWANRKGLFRAYRAASDKLEFCAMLPWVGPITKHHLVKNLGIDSAKSDVHLQRLADVEGISAHELCARLARQTSYRTSTVDTILWRACAISILNSGRYKREGWRAAHSLSKPLV